MKATFFISILLAGCLYSTADNPYYYSLGEKIPLTEAGDRMSVAVAASARVSMPSEYSAIREIDDDSFRIIVCKNDEQKDSGSDKASFKARLRAVSPKAMVSPCYRNAAGVDITITPYLNVKLKQASDYTLLENAAKENNLTIVSQDKFLPLWYILSVTPETNGTSLDIANRLYETGLFAESLADFSSENDMQCSYDPLVTRQWGLYNDYHEDIDISICGAWSYATGRGIKIGILDIGIYKDHKELARNIDSLSFDTDSGTSPAKWVEYSDTIQGLSPLNFDIDPIIVPPNLYEDHGTHCAGIAAAVRNNGIQVAGVAPDAKIVSISNSMKRNPNSQLKRADGIVWAYRNGVDVISNSWGSATVHPAINEAIADAFRYGREGKGCVIVFSAGNNFEENPDSIGYPASCNDKILAVGAIDSSGNRASFSQVGDRLDVVAPGCDILSTIPYDQVGNRSGTSMACPHVAGLAALILERNPRLTVTQVNDIIEKNTKKIGTDSYNENRKNGKWNRSYGYGLVNAEKALINTPRN